MIKVFLTVKELILNRYACYLSRVRLLKYLIPRSTVKPSQHRSTTRYINRMLPTGHRCRGDVGQV